MGLTELVKSNRSYRRFDESHAVSMGELEELVELARYTASAMNQQPLRYALVAEPGKNAEVFATTAWAGYLKDWSGPAEGERPAAYVVMMTEGKAGPWAKADLGIAAQTIMLGAAERGLGGCMLGALKKDALAEALGVDQEEHEILLVLALGKPAETVVVDDVEPGGDYKYWRDGEDVHHVPKRRSGDVVIRRWPGTAQEREENHG